MTITLILTIPAAILNIFSGIAQTCYGDTEEIQTPNKAIESDKIDSQIPNKAIESDEINNAKIEAIANAITTAAKNLCKEDDEEKIEKPMKLPKIVDIVEVKNTPMEKDEDQLTPRFAKNDEDNGFRQSKSDRGSNADRKQSSDDIQKITKDDKCIIKVILSARE